ncbi:tellurite resistance/C4-dicarboxylate transporter family protein [Microtetraspora niveoalba]|uniref:tellurite resistance/C4-dicarboxylate transporter family protein n=1 Tax=Microtetraspora niveoalba TaxID=46175 RepID=UPI000A652A21|nr:tellurite resistance/C4-dicarboxylate transporter family protein [Microtetraspora niveoalba]
MTPLTRSAETLRGAVRDLHPAYFALVMATGIISVDLRTAHATALSAALMWVAAAAYAVLLALTLARIAAYPRRLLRDLHDPHRGFGFFTFTAGTDVLGTRLALDGHVGTATALLAVGGLSWIVLGYAVPWAAALSHDGRESLGGAEGSWFVWVVGGQSVAVLAATLERTAGAGRDAVALLAIVFWAVSVCLYALVAICVALRLMLYAIRPGDLTPPYWVAMGATAISTLAGAQIATMTSAPAALATHLFTPHVSLIFWAFGTWLYPALVFIGWWRHVRRRVPLRYDPGWWSMVFPLGMYAAACHNLGEVIAVPALVGIGAVQVWIAFAAWLIAIAAMLRRFAGEYGLRRGRPGPGE